MNTIVKKLSLGLLIWAVPFVSSFLVWDVAANAPSVSQDWFNAIMAVAWAVGFAVAACVYFRGMHADTVAQGWSTGIVWYAELLVLDLVFLVGVFKMPLTGYYHLPVVYLNTLIMTVVIGYIKK